MLVFLFPVCTILLGAFAAPQDAVAPSIAPLAAAPNSPPIEIISQSDIVNADGSFNSSYETANGIKVEESGYIKPGVGTRVQGAEGEDDNSGDIQVITGSFSYTAPDGTVISLRYTADENGFQPQGDHLPTAPPIPEDIQRSLGAAAQNGDAQTQDTQKDTGTFQPQPTTGAVQSQQNTETLQSQ